MSQPLLPPSGFYRYPRSGDNTQSAFAISAGGPKSLEAGAVRREIFPLNQAQGLNIFFGGSGADNATFDYRLWLVTYTYSTAGVVNGTVYYYLGGGTATLGNGPTINGAAVESTVDRIADTVTFTEGTESTTPDGLYDKLQLSAWSASDIQTFSPANDNDAALLMIPATGWPDGLVIDFDMTGATAGFAMISRR